MVCHQALRDWSRLLLWRCTFPSPAIRLLLLLPGDAEAGQSVVAARKTFRRVAF